VSGSDGSIGSEGSEMPGSLSVDFLDVVGDCDAASLLARPLAREDKRGQRVVHLRHSAAASLAYDFLDVVGDCDVVSACIADGSTGYYYLERGLQ
jgi:hypothetical protein